MKNSKYKLNFSFYGDSQTLRFRTILLFLFLFTILPYAGNGTVPKDSGKPVILNYNEGALPGEAFGIQGASFGQEAELWYSPVNGEEKSLTPRFSLNVLTRSENYISAVLPDEKQLPTGQLVAVWVRNKQLWSEPLILNRARVVTVEFEEIMPGYTFRVFGRNLFFPGQKPIFKFFDSDKKQSFQGDILQADPYILTVKAPNELIPGKRYTLKVSNGSGGKWGESRVEESLLTRESAIDPFCIGAPWGANFKFHQNVYNVKTDTRLKMKAKGDSVTNDREAIQQAIDMAGAEGGGVVYFPTGKYKLSFTSGSGLTMRSNVVLKGDGPTLSVIQYGYGTPPPYPDPIGKGSWPDNTVDGVGLLWPLETSRSGLTGLCIQNVNTSGIWRHSLKTMLPNIKTPGSAGSEFFAINCRFDLSMAVGLAWSYVDRMIIADCDFESVTQNTWPWMWHCNGSTNFAVRGNRVHYAAGRFGFNDSYNGIIENNHITRLGNLQTFRGESGGFNIDYAKDIVVMRNLMDVNGAPVLPRNQGETILSQGCNPTGQSLGIVTAAASTSLTDAKQQWGPYNPRLLGSSRAVAIVNGKGTGQWRYVSGIKGSTLSVDRPWDIIPEVGSQYVFMTWSAEDWLVKDNILEGNHQGIMFYCGCNDVVIQGNKLTNSSGIYMRSDQRANEGRFNLLWNATIVENELRRTEGTRAVSIYSILAVQPKQALLGKGTIGLEIRRNLIQAKYPNVSSSVAGEGYWSEVKSSTPALLKNTVGILGTIYDKNTAVNCDYGYRLSQSVNQTIIKDPVNIDVKKATNESSFPESSALGTVIITGKDSLSIQKK